jgi:hypothetical protein
VNEKAWPGKGEKQVSLPVRHLPQRLFVVRVQSSKITKSAKLIITN